MAKEIAQRTLSQMSATERLRYMRSVTQQPAAPQQHAPAISTTESLAKAVATLSCVPTNFAAAYKYHRAQQLG